jgi:hypothetical protein
MIRTCANALSIAGTVFLLVHPVSVVHAAENRSTGEAMALQELRLKIGEPILQARLRIIKLGWTPTPMHQTDNYEYDGTEKQFAKRGIVEIDSCTVDAGALCTLYYNKAARCLRVDTIGENLPRITVTRWTEECPDKNR